jgi:membrane-associated protein
MNRRTFTAYNALGSLLWAGLLPIIGWAIAHIPGVAALVTEYIDLVLIGVVVVSAASVGIHWLRERRTMAKESRTER